MVQAPATYDRYHADFEAFEREAGGPEWLREMRREGIARFRELGLPTAREGNEPWKYTNVAPIAKTEFAYHSDGREAVVDLPSIALQNNDWATLVFVNGGASRVDASHRDASTTSLVATTLAEAITTHEDAVRRHLAGYATPDYDGFTALNTAFLSDGAYVRVPQEESAVAPVHIVYASANGAEPTVSYPRTLIVAESMSKLTIIETYTGEPGSRYFTDAVTEIVLGEGAQVDHYRLLLESTDAYHVGVTRVYQGRDSSFRSTSFAAGAALGRNDFKVLLDGEGGSCRLKGLYVTGGTQHIDNYIAIDHAKPHATSRLYYKGILHGKSRAVFGGTVFVRPGADKTDAYQEDKNLLLSAEAEVDSKPSLEIYADDVKCGHGATAGAVAEEAIFYMRSRGLDEETAMRLLIQGFASEILDGVQVEDLRAYLERITMEALAGIGASVGGDGGPAASEVVQ